MIEYWVTRHNPDGFRYFGTHRGQGLSWTHKRRLRHLFTRAAAEETARRLADVEGPGFYVIWRDGVPIDVVARVPADAKASDYWTQAAKGKHRER